MLIPNSWFLSFCPTPVIPFGNHKFVFYVYSVWSISSFIFLDSTYKWYCMVLVFLHLTYFTLYDNFSVQPCFCEWHYFILFHDWVKFHFSYIPHHLFPFFCQWTFRLLPCLGYCRQCCNQHWSACILLNQSFHRFWIYAQEWDCWITW